MPKSRKLPKVEENKESRYTKKKSLRAPYVNINDSTIYAPETASTTDFPFGYLLKGSVTIDKKESPVDRRTYEYSQSITGTVKLTYPDQTQQSFVLFQDEHKSVGFPEVKVQKTKPFTARQCYYEVHKPSVLLVNSYLVFLMQHCHFIDQCAPIISKESKWDITRKQTETENYDLIVLDLKTGRTLRENIDARESVCEFKGSQNKEGDITWNYPFNHKKRYHYRVKHVNKQPNKIAITCYLEGSGEGAARIYEITPNKLCKTIHLKDQVKVTDILESPCEQYVVTSTWSGALSLYQKDGKNKEELLWHKDSIADDHHFSFHPNGELFAKCSLGWTHFKIFRIDLKTGDPEFICHENEHSHWDGMDFDEEGVLTVWNDTGKGCFMPQHCKNAQAEEKQKSKLSSPFICEALLDAVPSFYPAICGVVASYVGEIPGKVVTTQYVFTSVKNCKYELLAKHLESVSPIFESTDKKFNGKENPYKLVAEYIGTIPQLTLFSPKKEPHQFISFFRFSETTRRELQRLYQNVVTDERRALLKLLVLAGKLGPDGKELSLIQCLEQTLKEFCPVLPSTNAVIGFLRKEIDSYRPQLALACSASTGSRP